VPFSAPPCEARLCLAFHLSVRFFIGKVYRSSGRFAVLYAMGRQYWDELYAHLYAVNYGLGQSGMA